MVPAALAVSAPMVPPIAVMWAAEKSAGGWLKVKVTVAVGWATLTSALPTATATVGATVSTTKTGLVNPAPRLPAASCQVLSTLTEPLAMLVPGVGVEVGVEVVAGGLAGRA